jgi:hypothetical protein
MKKRAKVIYYQYDKGSCVKIIFWQLLTKGILNN